MRSAYLTEAIGMELAGEPSVILQLTPLELNMLIIGLESTAGDQFAEDLATIADRAFGDNWRERFIT